MVEFLLKCVSQVQTCLRMQNVCECGADPTICNDLHETLGPQARARTFVISSGVRTGLLTWNSSCSLATISPALPCEGVHCSVFATAVTFDQVCMHGRTHLGSDMTP